VERRLSVSDMFSSNFSILQMKISMNMASYFAAFAAQSFDLFTMRLLLGRHSLFFSHVRSIFRPYLSPSGNTYQPKRNQMLKKLECLSALKYIKPVVTFQSQSLDCHL